MSLRRGYKILRAAEGGVMFIFLLVGGGVMNILYCDKKSKCGNNRGTTIVLTNMMLPFSSVKYCAALVKLSG